MNVVVRFLNFVLGLTAVLLILLGVTDPESPYRTTMVAVGIGLFVLTFLVHMITKMMGKAAK